MELFIFALLNIFAISVSKFINSCLFITYLYIILYVRCYIHYSNNSNGIYQELSKKYSAIETPTWSLLLAESCRSKGFKVDILDCLAENLNDEEAYKRISSLNPKLIVFVVYGQNVNAGTTNMSGAVRLSNFLKKK